MRAAPGGAFRALAERLGRDPDAPGLLARAVAHRSFCAENPGNESNERLEFLGDAVLGVVVTDHIFRSHPTLPEGELAKLRASVVNSAALAEVAADLDLGSCMLLGKGEDASGGRDKPSILADALEAVIGATYIDVGLPAATTLVMDLLGERMAEAAMGPGGQDHKTRLQELASGRFHTLPRYEVEDEGPDHAKHFRAAVTVAGRRFDGGEGRSKKQAEQAVARTAWTMLSAELFEGAAPPAPAEQAEEMESDGA